jgi:hypothetical protein
MYTPQFSDTASISVRRLAWAIEKPMGAAVDLMVSLLPSIVDPSIICPACRDKTKCKNCIFITKLPAEKETALAAV